MKQYQRDYRRTHPDRTKTSRNKRQHQKTVSAVRHAKSDGCVLCGYKKCLEALDFHHVSPDWEPGNRPRAFTNLSPGQLTRELSKCIVVCANCHREIHAGKVNGYVNVHTERAVVEDTPPLLRLIENG